MNPSGLGTNENQLGSGDDGMNGPVAKARKGIDKVREDISGWVLYAFYYAGLFYAIIIATRPARPH